jgi:hypothetical protein
MNDEQKARVIANCEIIAKALREGLQLQWRNTMTHTEWINDELNHATRVGPHAEYRIKPEPRTLWVNEHSYDHHTGHDSAAAARHCANADARRIAVEYREVVK